MKSLQYLFISLSHKILKHLPYTTIRILSVPIGTLYFLLTFRSSIKLFKRKEIFNELKRDNSLKMLPKKINPNQTMPQFSIWADNDSTIAFILNN